MDYTVLISAYVLLQYTPSYHAVQQQCNVIFHYNFENCRWGGMDDVIANKFPENQCVDEDICRRHFDITIIKLLPYYLMHTQIVQMLDICCGKCAKLRIVNTFTDLSKVSVDSLASSDFIFPFLGPTSTEQLHGFYFIPLYDAPSATYITMKKQSPKETLFNLIRACADLWPLLLICLLMALISGFIAWLLETWNNVIEFPRPFHIGLFEGFWWSFISMTTVGYGDKSPRSWPARVYSIFWILIGITICSMFTASLTTEITSAVTPVTPEIMGNKIGWFNGRLYEATLIAQYGGTLQTIADDDFISGIERLFQLLTDGEVEGIVLDTYIFNFLKMMMRDKQLYNFIANKSTNTELFNDEIYTLIANKTTHTEIINKGEKLSFGMLVRNTSHNSYFRKYFIDNHMQMEACNLLSLNLVSEVQEVDNMLFSVKAGVFWPFFGGSIGILALIGCFGIVFELVRRKIICRSIAVAEEDGCAVEAVK